MSNVGWMASGEDSAKLAEAEKAAAEKRKAEQGKAFRFFLKKGGEGKILFADGDLHPKLGTLCPPRFYEHFVMLAGTWVNVVCPQQTRPDSGDKCPICESKDKPSLVSLFTVVDLTPYTTKEGKVIPFTRKLFVAKPTTFEMLNTLAVKRGGLKGCIFDVYRKGDKAASVGDVFDFQEKISDMESVKAKYTVTFKFKDNGVEKEKTVCMADPLKYGDEIIFRTGDELRKMGFGAPAGTSIGQASSQEPNDVKDYSAEL